MATLQFSQDGESPPKSIHRTKQLLNHIVDGTAVARPSAIYAEVPRSFDSYEPGYRRITYRALANAVNGIAWWLHQKLGRGRDHQTLAYVGPNDLTNVIMILGAVKAGYKASLEGRVSADDKLTKCFTKMLLISPRNTVHDHIHLFEETQCRVILAPINLRSPVLQAILEVSTLPVLDSPSLEELLDNSYPPYQYLKTFVEARNEPLLVVHTSGTTGRPKPIVFTHDFAASFIQWDQLAPPPGFESQVALCQSNRFFVTLPFFHAGNLFATLFDAIANQTTVITPLAGVMPSAQNVIDGLRIAKADAVFLAPPFLEQIAKDPEMLNTIAANAETVVYGGGDVSQSLGDALASKVQLFNFNGSTETGSFPLLRPSGQFPSQDWKYIQPHPAAGLEFRPSVHGLYEAVIVKNRVYEDEQPVFKIFPHLEEYPTKDLWAPHPTKPGLWAYRGRADDTIVFKPGHMCDPVPMEQTVTHHAGVRAVLMAGTGRFQPALLVERASDHTSISDLWPLINEANQMYPLGARVAQSHILFIKPQQPMPRAGKGTVQRGPSLEQYKDELDKLYIREGDAVPGNELVLP
ncbi:MAG: hypothetical protein L6R35_003344 [Caloplaca aegaea]|nr:MAG: hypothetical protein L6R35_003344 [Caloplaca aegaea]